MCHNDVHIYVMASGVYRNLEMFNECITECSEVLRLVGEYRHVYNHSGEEGCELQGYGACSLTDIISYQYTTLMLRAFSYRKVEQYKYAGKCV